MEFGPPELCKLHGSFLLRIAWKNDWFWTSRALETRRVISIKNFIVKDIDFGLPGELSRLQTSGGAKSMLFSTELWIEMRCRASTVLHWNLARTELWLCPPESRIACAKSIAHGSIRHRLMLSAHCKYIIMLNCQGQWIVMLNGQGQYDIMLRWGCTQSNLKVNTRAYSRVTLLPCLQWIWGSNLKNCAC